MHRHGWRATIVDSKRGSTYYHLGLITLKQVLLSIAKPFVLQFTFNIQFDAVT